MAGGCCNGRYSQTSSGSSVTPGVLYHVFDANKKFVNAYNSQDAATNHAARIGGTSEARRT